MSYKGVAGNRSSSVAGALSRANSTGATSNLGNVFGPGTQQISSSNTRHKPLFNIHQHNPEFGSESRGSIENNKVPKSCRTKAVQARNLTKQIQAETQPLNYLMTTGALLGRAGGQD